MGVVVLLLAVAAGTFAFGAKAIDRRFEVQDRAVATLVEQVEGLAEANAKASGAVERLTERLAVAEAELADDLDLTALADGALPSVFTVEVQWPGGGGQGSAFVIGHGDGGSLLVTNYHVVEGAWVRGLDEVRLLKGDLTYPGHVTLVSAADDLAVLEVAEDLPSLPVRRQVPAVGETLIVIGSPYGLEGTVATGIVSAIRGRHLQFSAPVSPGDSGGPVIDDQGRVVAITVAKVAARGAEGLSFGIPVRVVCSTLVACRR